ncbi:MAG: TonB-dependent receptor plug domain-containing protein, partial [Marinifilaceae bacterium]|nr:TonB-dependent receptor plug domain-containing protein [Marinifilaceae bacterium]
MEKRVDYNRFHQRWWRKKMETTRKCLLLCLLSFMSAIAFAQQKVSLDVKDQPLLKVLNLLQDQSDYTFLFTASDVENVTGISVKAVNEDLLDVLRKCLRGTNLTFEVSDKLIVLKQLPPAANSVQVNITVKGFVYDEKKQPMPGVTVQVIGTSMGTATTEKGWFSITLPILKGKLKFSFVGYKSQEVEFTEKTDTLIVILEKNVTTMSEVVVTGYGNIQKGNYTGAATTIKAADIMVAGVTSIDQMLQGIVPGMLVQNTSGMVGTTPKIRVRGTSTLLGSQEPVWVVDGVVQQDPQPFNSDENTSFSVDADDISQLAGNAISWLNPNDIETITVLKDASATAIYGSQAA